MLTYPVNLADALQACPVTGLSLLARGRDERGRWWQACDGITRRLEAE